MNSTLHGATAEYIEAVRDALADQPASEVEEVIDDVTEHLEQVVTELGGDPTREDLEERLGAPRHYAEELRAAAGLSGLDASARPRGRRRMAVVRFVATWLLRLGASLAIVGSLVVLEDRWNGPDDAAVAYLLGLVPVGVALLLWLGTHRSMDWVAALRQLPDATRIEAGVSALRARPWGLAAVEFVESLRPAWWLLRAWIATQILLGALGVEVVFPIDPSPVAVVVLLAAIIASVWWGRRVVAGLPAGLPTRASRIGNFALAVVAPAMLLLASPGANTYAYDDPEVVYENVPQTEGFFHEDGTEIINLYAYGPDGALIEGAQIYDQDGRPVENVAPWRSGDCIHEGGWYPGGPQSNVFPRPAVSHNESGPPGCAEPGEAAPFGSSLPGSAIEPGVAEAEVDTGPDVDATVEPDPAKTQGAQPDDGVPGGEGGR